MNYLKRPTPKSVFLCAKVFSFGVCVISETFPKSKSPIQFRLLDSHSKRTTLVRNDHLWCNISFGFDRYLEISKAFLSFC